MEKGSGQGQKYYKYSFFKAGTKIFNQGDRGTDIYILKKGAVTVIVDDQIVGLINTPETIIGEMAYFLNLYRTASVEAVEDSEFIIISGEYLYETVMKKPKIGIDLIKILSARLAKTTKHLTHLEHEIIDYRNELRTLKGIAGEMKPNALEKLVSYGFLSHEQMAECKKALENANTEKKNVSLSRILVEKNYLSPEQLVQFLEIRQDA
jgi:CRP-like cAMP-binding protein